MIGECAGLSGEESTQVFVFGRTRLPLQGILPVFRRIGDGYNVDCSMSRVDALSLARVVIADLAVTKALP